MNKLATAGPIAIPLVDLRYNRAPATNQHIGDRRIPNQVAVLRSANRGPQG